MMAKQSTLVADLEAIIEKTDRVMLDVMRFSIQDLVEDTQTPTAKGGRMRVDTGFLRASGRAQIGGWPSGPSKRPADAPVGKHTGIYDDFDGAGSEVVSATLGKMQPGDTFFFGWTANYAQYRELYDGFLEGAVQRWQKIVDDRIAEINRLRGKQ